MANYTGRGYYSEKDLQMINDLKVLKGRLKGRDPTEQEVDKAPGMASSRAYKDRFGPSWLQVLMLVRGSFVSSEGDDEDEAAAKYARKIEKEIPASPQVSAVAPELEEMFKEIERGTPIDATPEMPQAKAEAARKEIEKAIEKPEAPVDVPKVTEAKTKSSKVEEPKAETKAKEEKPKVAKTLTKKPKEEEPPKIVAEKKTGLNLVNLMGKDVILSSGDFTPKKLVAFGSVEVRLEKVFDEETVKTEFVSVPVLARRAMIREKSSQEYLEMPEVRKGTYFILAEEMVRNIQKTGRWTDDLLFPTIFFETEDLIYVHQLEVINS